MFLGFPEYTLFEICTQPVRKDVMNNFVMRLKKCKELNGDHLEHTFSSAQGWPNGQHVLVLYLESNKPFLV